MLVVAVAVLVLLGSIGGRALGSWIFRRRGVADAQLVEIDMQHRLGASSPSPLESSVRWPRPLTVIPVTYSGPGLVALLGESHGPVVFRSNVLSARVDPRDIAALRESFGRAVSAWGPWQHEFRITHPRSGTRWIAVTAAYDETFDCGSRWHAFLEDVTTQRHSPDSHGINVRVPKMALSDVACPLGIVVGQPLAGAHMLLAAGGVGSRAPGGVGRAISRLLLDLATASRRVSWLSRPRACGVKCSPTRVGGRHRHGGRTGATHTQR